VEQIATLSDSSTAALQRLTLLRRLLVVATAILCAATWRLWTIQTLFPRIPLFDWALALPVEADWWGLAGMGISLLVVLVTGQGSRLGSAALAGVAMSVLSLIVLDQHRIQPWAYQFSLMALILAAMPAPRALFWLRLLTVSIYFHSAVSKLDVGFLDSLGLRFLDVLFAKFGWNVIDWPQGAQRLAVLMFSVGEILIALGLCVRRWRFTALCGAIVMHALMLVVLGPRGLNHRPAVLIWNVYFILQDWVLFGPQTLSATTALATPAAIATGRLSQKCVTFAVEVLVTLACLLPFLEPWGWWDHWPSWGLYSTRAERAVVLIEQTSRDNLPPHLQKFLETTAAYPGWLRLRLDRWSLADLAVPIYPQNRFQAGVAGAVAGRYVLSDNIRLVLEGTPNRWNGVRAIEEFVGTEAILQRCRSYRCNALARGELR
jgi:hypothetical protein